MKILDSDHCVALLRGRMDLHGLVAPTEELAVTTISVGELTHGAYRSARAAENLARLEVLLASMIILPYDEGSARRFGFLKVQLERTGMRLNDLDIQIAGIALQHNTPLVSHNQRHFGRVPGLMTEDWLAEGAV